MLTCAYTRPAIAIGDRAARLVADLYRLDNCFDLTDRWVFPTIACMSPVKRGETLPIHNRIRVLRAERGMSRADLAALIEVNPQTVGALERGDHYPSLDLAFRICDVFDLPVEAVFSRTEFAPLSGQVYRRDMGGD